jgi:S-DNA-T family DNA segregation ATPase FtsK/SpoIIIE
VNGATRHTTKDASSDALERLLVTIFFQPATVPAAGTFAALVAAHARRPVAIAAAVAVWLLGSAAFVAHRQLGVVPRLRRAMADLGLVYRHPNDVVQAPQCRGRRRRSGRNVRLRWELPPGVTLRDVLDRKEAIEHHCQCELDCWAEDGLLMMVVMRHRIPRVVPFADFYRGARPHGRLLVGLGQGRRGALWVDLAALPHLLVGGMTGGGKSVFLRQALTALVLENRPARLQLVCLDLKGGVELAHFGDLPHAMWPVADSLEGAAAALSEVRVELDRRLEALRRSGMADIDAWLDAGMPAWPRMVVVVDELAELTTREAGRDSVAREAQRAGSARLTEIARLGRAVGIHLIVCTQRPDADAVPGQLKANLAGTVAFRVRAGVNSLILLDTDRAALLPHHPGRALWAEERVEEFQAVYLSNEESRRLLVERWGEPRLDASPARVSPGCQSPQEGTEDPRLANS